jgi:hypothetical protein
VQDRALWLLEFQDLVRMCPVEAICLVGQLQGLSAKVRASTGSPRDDSPIIRARLCGLIELHM